MVLMIMNKAFKKFNDLMQTDVDAIINIGLPIIIVIVIVLAVMSAFGNRTENKPVVVKPPVTAQGIGEDLGSKTGRFVGGFVKGLWKREEKK